MWIRLQSDAALAANVTAHAAAGGIAVVPVGGLAGLPGAGTAAAPYRVPMSPLQFLLAAGRATAAIGPTPMARFNTVGWWTVFRWYWTVQTAAAGHVDLTPDSNNVNNHHRTAFSEGLALGMALRVAEIVIGAGGLAVPLGPAAAAGVVPIVVDVDSIMPGQGTRPDLLVLGGLPVAGVAPASALIEAKGRSETGALVGRLAAGIHQVLAIPGATSRIVAGVEVPRTSLRGFAIEVPGAAPAGAPAPGPAPAAPPPPPPPPRFPDRDGGPGPALESIPPERIAAADGERLRAFAGLDGTFPVSRQPRLLAPGIEVDLEGVTFRTRVGGRTDEVTVGVLGHVADEIRDGGGDPGRYDRAQNVARDIARSLPDADPDDPDVATRGTVALDGCAIAARRL